MQNRCPTIWRTLRLPCKARGQGDRLSTIEANRGHRRGRAKNGFRHPLFPRATRRPLDGCLRWASRTNSAGQHRAGARRDRDANRNSELRCPSVLLVGSYAAELDVPFVLAALSTGKLVAEWRHFVGSVRALQVNAGVVTVLMGVAMLTGHLTRFAFWSLKAFPVLAGSADPFCSARPYETKQLSAAFQRFVSDGPHPPKNGCSRSNPAKTFKSALIEQTAARARGSTALARCSSTVSRTP